VAAREWLTYDINVPVAGTYQFEIRSARAPQPVMAEFVLKSTVSMLAAP